MTEEIKNTEIENSSADENDGVSFTHEEYLAMTEAVLFAAGYPLTYEKLSETPLLSVEEVVKIVKELSEKYSSETRGLHLLVYDDSCQLCTREEYAPQIRVALGIKQGGRLSNSALETLAIVAYSQPVTRLQIEKIRGVDSQYAVASLCAKNLIEPKGRLELPGRPVIFGTTADFLRCFGISSLDELPDAKAFVSAAQVKLGEDAEEGAEEDGAVEITV